MHWNKTSPPTVQEVTYRQKEKVLSVCELRIITRRRNCTRMTSSIFRDLFFSIANLFFFFFCLAPKTSALKMLSGLHLRSLHLSHLFLRYCSVQSVGAWSSALWSWYSVLRLHYEKSWKVCLEWRDSPPSPPPPSSCGSWRPLGRNGECGAYRNGRLMAVEIS